MKRRLSILRTLQVLIAAFLLLCGASSASAETVELAEVCDDGVCISGTMETIPSGTADTPGATTDVVVTLTASASLPLLGSMNGTLWTENFSTKELHQDGPRSCSWNGITEASCMMSLTIEDLDCDPSDPSYVVTATIDAAASHNVLDIVNLFGSAILKRDVLIDPCTSDVLS